MVGHKICLHADGMAHYDPFHLDPHFLKVQLFEI